MYSISASYQTIAIDPTKKEDKSQYNGEKKPTAFAMESQGRRRRRTSGRGGIAPDAADAQDPTPERQGVVRLHSLGAVPIHRHPEPVPDPELQLPRPILPQTSSPIDAHQWL